MPSIDLDNGIDAVIQSKAAYNPYNNIEAEKDKAKLKLWVSKPLEVTSSCKHSPKNLLSILRKMITQMELVSAFGASTGAFIGRLISIFFSMIPYMFFMALAS